MVKVSVGRDAIDDDLGPPSGKQQLEAHQINIQNQTDADQSSCPSQICSPNTSFLIDRRKGFALPGGSGGDKSQRLHIPYDSQRHPPVPTHQAQCAHAPTPIRPTAVQILHCHHQQTSQRQKRKNAAVRVRVRVSFPELPPHLSPPPYIILCISLLTIHVPMCMMGVLTRAM